MSDRRNAVLLGIVCIVVGLVVWSARPDASSDQQGVSFAFASTPRASLTPRPPAVGQGIGAERASLAGEHETPATMVAEEMSDGRQSIQTPAPAATIVASSQPVVVAPTLQSATPTVVVSSLAPPTGSLEEQVRGAVEAYFPPSEWATAMRIAWCESRYQPWAAEPGGNHFGVFQVDPSLWGAVPADIDGQVRQAAAVWLVGGWAMWSCA